MQSFTEHMRGKQVTRLAETAFVLMAQRGVHPIKFVEWFATEGHLLSETAAPVYARQWLEDELILNEDDMIKSGAAAATGATLGGLIGTVGGPVGTGVGAAVGGLVGTALNNRHDKWKAQPAQSPAVTGAQQALDSLSRNLPKNFQNNQNFVQSLHAIIAALKAPVQPQPTPAANPAAPAAPQATGDQFQQQANAGFNNGTPPASESPSDGTNPFDFGPQTAPAPAPAKRRWPWQRKPAAAPAPAAAPTVSHYNPQQDDFLSKMIFERRVRSACTQLVEHGVDPRKFVHWYINEGRFLKTEEQFQEGIGDFFAQVGSGIGSWAGGQGFHHGYNAERERRQTQRERDAVGAATHALQQLKEFIPQVPGGQFGGPDIMKHIDLMLGELTKSAAEQQNVPPAPEGSEEAPQDGSEEGGEEGAGDQAEKVKQELHAAGVDVSVLKPQMLSKYAQELAAITDPAQRTAKLEEIKKMIPADVAIDNVNRNDTGDMDDGDAQAIKAILQGAEDEPTKRQKVAQHLASKAPAASTPPTVDNAGSGGVGGGLPGRTTEHNDLMRSLSAYNQRPKSWFS